MGLGRLGRGHLHGLAARHSNLVDRGVQLEAVGRLRLLDEVGAGQHLVAGGVAVLVRHELEERAAGAGLVRVDAVLGPLERVPVVGLGGGGVGRSLLQFDSAVVGLGRLG